MGCVIMGGVAIVLIGVNFSTAILMIDYAQVKFRPELGGQSVVTRGLMVVVSDTLWKLGP